MDRRTDERTDRPYFIRHPKMQLKAQRLSRYEKRNTFYSQNVIFKRAGKNFYREIGKETITVNVALSIEEVENFWKDIWSEEKGFN